MNQEILNNVRLIKPGDVMRLLGVSQRTLQRMVADKDVPAPIRIGKRGTRWRESDIISYIQTLYSKE